MHSKFHLGFMDYVVLAISLLISAGIGIYTHFSGKDQNTTQEFLMAGKKMSKFPVIISITVTMLSAFTMLSHPSEIYRYGLQRAIMIVSTVVGAYLAAVIFVPVYFQTNVSTTNEFLEIRFGRITRFVISALFTFNTIAFMSVVLYAPSLALNAVTDLSLEVSIAAIGLVCTFYCSLGGLRAVLWTDVFQAVLMLLCLIAVYIQSIREAGGIVTIYKRSYDGERLSMFNMSLDFVTRYTFLNVFIKGIVSGLYYYGTSQIEVQRMLSLSDVSKAKSSLIWSNVPASILLLFCYFLGLILYAIFYECDPVLNACQTGITKYDQIVPYYIATRLTSIPGIAGLCIAGIFSGTLSTLSSALNSLATVTVVDFIRPLCTNTRLTETKTVYLAKGFSVLYGVLCIAFAFALRKVDSLMQIVNILMSITEGPVLAVFLIAVLSRRGSQKSILFGLFVGVVFSVWIGYVSVFSGYIYPSLPLTTEGCLNSSISREAEACADALNCTNSYMMDKHSNSEPFEFRKISFLWFSTFGCVITLVCIIFGELITGWNKNLIPSDSVCLSPVRNLWRTTCNARRKSIKFLNESINLQDH